MCTVSRRMPISTLTLGRVTRRTSRGVFLMDKVYGLREFVVLRKYLRLGDLKGFLVQRGYDHDFIDTQFLRVRNHDQADLLESKKKLGNTDNFGDRVCCVVDYHPVMSCLNQLFKHLQGIVGFERKTLVFVGLRTLRIT